VFSALHEVVDTAVERGAEPEELPAEYLTPHRQPGTDCPRCEGQIERIKVSGRSAYFCPSCQARPES
jgi:formamidopyrimidine-DNA glycosylase